MDKNYRESRILSFWAAHVRPEHWCNIIHNTVRLVQKKDVDQNIADETVYSDDQAACLDSFKCQKSSIYSEKPKKKTE